MGRLPSATDDRDARNPIEFNRSLFLTQGLATAAYLTMGITAFYFAGRDLAPFVIFSVPPGPLRIVVALLLCVHILVAFALVGQPLLLIAHETVSPKTAHGPGAATLAGRAKHFAVTLVVLAANFIVANVIPFFER